jgi:putative ABC transport system permease protein
MIRVALRGLAARRLRTCLTALAIVLGVAMVSAAFTLTDTMRGAADSLSSAAYDGTDGVVTAKTAFAIGTDDWSLSRPTVDAALLSKVRSVPEVAVATGDISDEAKIVGRDGKTVGDGPYFGAGYDASVAGAERTTPFRLQSGRFATGPGEVAPLARLLRAHRRRRLDPELPRRRHRQVRHRQVARHGDVRRVRPQDRAEDLPQGGPL